MMISLLLELGKEGREEERERGGGERERPYERERETNMRERDHMIVKERPI